MDEIIPWDEMAGIIEKASGDILIVIRGGGSDFEFEVFNSFRLLEKLRDFSVQAEKHKKDIQELNKQIQENQEKAQNEIKNIMEKAKIEILAVNRAKDETLKDYLNNLEKKEREARELSNSLSVSVNELKEAGEKLKLFKIVAGVAVVVVVLLFLKLMF